MFLKKRSDQRAPASTLLRHHFLTNDNVGSGQPAAIAAPLTVKTSSNLNAIVRNAPLGGPAPGLAAGPSIMGAFAHTDVEGDAGGSSDDDLIPGM
jgi:hypothetical protein